MLISAVSGRIIQVIVFGKVGVDFVKLRNGLLNGTVDLNGWATGLGLNLPLNVYNTVARDGSIENSGLKGELDWVNCTWV